MTQIRECQKEKHRECDIMTLRRETIVKFIRNFYDTKETIYMH